VADVTNYWPDPDFRTTNRTGVVAFNLFPNPSPTTDLTAWSGSVVRHADASLFPETSFGGRVTGTVTLTGASTNWAGTDWTFTGKVKAAGAQTITISMDMLNPAQTHEIRKVGWGNFGWGETVTYVEGASKSFAAGEEAVFRIFGGDAGSTGGVAHQVQVILTGGGTFDVDGIMQSAGVDDGIGLVNIPDAPLFFYGDTPDDTTYTYSWTGTPGNSPSVQTANIPKHAWCTYDYEFEEHALPGVILEGAFHAVVGGEHRLALRSELGFGHPGRTILHGDQTAMPADPETEAGITLPAGKNWVMTFDVVKDYQTYYEGGEEPQFGAADYFGIEDATTSANLAYMSNGGYPPYRTRIMLPFPTVSGSLIKPEISGYMNWASGDRYITNVGIFEIPNIYHRYTGLTYAADGIYNLWAMGLTAGGTYRAQMEVSETNSHPIIEYKVGAGSWTTLVESTTSTTGDDAIHNEFLDFTVPGTATDVRLRLTDTTVEIGTFDLFDAPPAFFDGDTTDGGGYSYAWSGTPYDSASVRSDAGGSVSAQVFIGTTAVPVSEIRLASGGVLIPITELGT